MSRLSDRVSAQIDVMVKNLTGEEIVEIGIGLVARGLFRTSERDGIDKAVIAADAVSSTTTAMHLDFYRRAESDRQKRLTSVV